MASYGGKISDCRSDNAVGRVLRLFVLELWFRFQSTVRNILSLFVGGGGRTGLVVRASDSGSGDPGSIHGRVGVLFP